MSSPKFAPIGFDPSKVKKTLEEKRMQPDATICNTSGAEEEDMQDQICVLPGHDLVVTEEPESPGPQPKEELEKSPVGDTLAQLAAPEHGDEMTDKEIDIMATKGLIKMFEEMKNPKEKTPPKPQSILDIVESFKPKPKTPDLNPEKLSESSLEKLAKFPPQQAYSAILEGCGYSQSRISHMINVNRSTIWRWSRGQEYRYFKTETGLELSNGLKKQVMGLAVGVIQNLEVGRLTGELETSDLLTLLKTLMPFLAEVEKNKK
jgi:hypothetical protein